MIRKKKWNGTGIGRVKARLIRKDAGRKRDNVVYGLFLVSLLFYALVKIVPSQQPYAFKREMLRASRSMAEALQTISKCRGLGGMEIDSVHDVNRTGIIGSEWSPLTTSVGHLGSKRTSCNPNMAGLVVFLLREAGVRRGDAVAVGASGSFPALMIAVLSAARVMDVRPLLICSLGASQWGANDPDFHSLTMLECLRREGILDTVPIAVTLGGGRDVGEDMDPDFRRNLIREVEKSGIPFFEEPRLWKNVERRRRLWAAAAEGQPLKAFINIGGSFSNLGNDSSVLKLKPGLNRIEKFPPAANRGVIFDMASRGIPVLHLLYVQGLVQRFGLPWDPVPLPAPGEGELYRRTKQFPPEIPILGGAYLILCVFIFIFAGDAKRKAAAVKKI